MQHTLTPLHYILATAIGTIHNKYLLFLKLIFGIKEIDKYPVKE
jgi:hypothetical protein